MKKKLISGLVLTAILVWLMLKQTSAEVIADTVMGIPLWGVGTGLLIYIAYYFFLTLRFDSLIHSKTIPLVNLFGVTAVHNMMNNLLPARTGELSYIYLLKKKFDLRGSEGAATLLVARLMDFIAIFSYFILSSIFISEVMVAFNLMLASVFFIILLFLVLFYLRRICDFMIFLLEVVPIPLGRLQSLAIEKGRDVSVSIKVMFESGEYFKCIFLTAVIWGFRNLMIYVIVNCMGLDLSFWQVVFAVTAMFIVVSLPVQGLAGIGTLETGWLLGFTLLGLDKQLAISTGFGFHIILLFYTMTTGLVGFFMMNMRVKGRCIG